MWADVGVAAAASLLLPLARAPPLHRQWSVLRPNQLCLSVFPALLHLPSWRHPTLTFCLHSQASLCPSFCYFRSLKSLSLRLASGGALSWSLLWAFHDSTAGGRTPRGYNTFKSLSYQSVVRGPGPGLWATRTSRKIGISGKQWMIFSISTSAAMLREYSNVFVVYLKFTPYWLLMFTLASAAS